MSRDGPANPHGERVGPTLRAAAVALAGLPQATPRLEAELLLAQVTGWPRTRLIAWPDQVLDTGTVATFATLLARRLTGEPLAYVLGRQAFWTLNLRVTPDTLIPRPETELLVELALELLPDPQRPWRVADLGTGSGAIAAALASERPRWRVFAADRSAPALAVAQANFRALGLVGVQALRADWLAPFGAASLDCILANPPYVAAADPHLSQGDLPFEPAAALVAGPEGLDAIRRILADATRCLRPGGALAIEHGCDQGPAVRGLLARHGLRDPETRRDLAGLERASLAWAPSGRGA